MTLPDPDVETHLQSVKLGIAERVKAARENHPNGPMTRTALADAAGVSLRNLVDIEAGNSNLGIDTLVKITIGLGVQRPAYLIDPQVFAEVNQQLASLKKISDATRELGATSIMFRNPGFPADPSHEDLATILEKIVALGSEARRQVNTNNADDGSPQP